MEERVVDICLPWCTGDSRLACCALAPSLKNMFPKTALVGTDMIAAAEVCWLFLAKFLAGSCSRYTSSSIYKVVFDVVELVIIVILSIVVHFHVYHLCSLLTTPRLEYPKTYLRLAVILVAIICLEIFKDQVVMIFITILLIFSAIVINLNISCAVLNYV